MGKFDFEDDEKIIKIGNPFMKLDEDNVRECADLLMDSIKDMLHENDGDYKREAVLHMAFMKLTEIVGRKNT